MDMMKIGILQAGRTPPELRQRHGDYDELYKHMLAGRGFEFDTYPVLEGVFPSGPEAADGWLITGSRYSAYEPHEWIAPLEEFLRQAYGAGVPVIGVCFGHQILAQALGGKVEKFDGGWSVGAVDYELEGVPEKRTIMAWHQDQVVKLPHGAEVRGSSAHCKYAMLAYGDRAISVQPHPEFSAQFVKDLIEARRDVLPAEIATEALGTLGRELNSVYLADQFEAFFKENRNKSGAASGAKA